MGIDDCPKCGSKMEKGYISSTNRICWVKKRPRLIVSGDSIVPLSLTHAPSVEAYRCRKCRIVTFKY